MTRLVSSTIGLLLMVAVWPGFSGLATTPRWDVGVLIAVALFLTSQGRATAAHWIGFALIGWLALSVTWSSDPGAGADQVLKFVVVAVAFALGATLTDLRQVVAGAAVGIAVSGVIALAQWFGWTAIETASAGTPAGLFFNHNRAAEAAVLVFAATVALRMWWFIPGLLPSLILPQERTAWLAVAVVVGLMIWRRLRQFDRFVLACIAIMLVALVAMTAEIWRSYNFGSLAVFERLTIWQFALERITVFGHGIGSFTGDGPMLLVPVAPGANMMEVSKASHPHNEFLWLAYEGGLPALAVAAAFGVVVWRACVGELRLVLVALGIIACFAMPFHDPATVVLAAVVAGFAVGDRDRIRAAAHARGSALLAWVEQGRGSGSESVGAAPGAGALPAGAAVS